MQDGSIQYEVKLTGCLSTSVLSEGEGVDPTHGTLIGPHLNAQLHQHYFCVRLDMSVDDPDGGAALTVTEVSTLSYAHRDEAQCTLLPSCVMSAHAAYVQITGACCRTSTDATRLPSEAVAAVA